VRLYAAPSDVDDIVQDAFLTLAQRPPKGPMSERAMLSWLIGVAKRHAPAYMSREIETISFDQLLELEGGIEHEEPKLDPWELVQR
jgi:DNA-directed RNA polymerase specialized sigma24 family protein